MCVYTMEWTRDDVLNLIEKYRKYTVLWDPNDDSYKIARVKSNAWVFLAREIGVDTTEVKKKINSLLASYRRERQKMHAKKAVYGEAHSPWFYYNSMKFLADRDKPRKPMQKSQDTGSLPTEETSEEFKPVKCKDEEIDPADIYNNVHQDAIALSSVETSEDEIVCKEEEIDVTPAIENMEEEEEEASASASGNVAVPPPRQLPGGGSLDSRQAKEVAPGVCNDEFHHFGMNLAWQLRRMPLRAAIETQLEIQRLLTAKRLEYLD